MLLKEHASLVVFHALVLTWTTWSRASRGKRSVEYNRLGIWAVTGMCLHHWIYTKGRLVFPLYGVILSVMTCLFVRSSVFYYSQREELVKRLRPRMQKDSSHRPAQYSLSHTISTLDLHFARLRVDSSGQRIDRLYKCLNNSVWKKCHAWAIRRSLEWPWLMWIALGGVLASYVFHHTVGWGLEAMGYALFAVSMIHTLIFLVTCVLHMDGAIPYKSCRLWISMVMLMESALLMNPDPSVSVVLLCVVYAQWFLIVTSKLGWIQVLCNKARKSDSPHSSHDESQPHPLSKSSAITKSLNRIDQHGYELMQFCKHEHTSENLYFWKIMQQFRSLRLAFETSKSVTLTIHPKSSAKGVKHQMTCRIYILWTEVESIYTTFMSTSSPLELNLSSTVMKGVVSRFEEMKLSGLHLKHTSECKCHLSTPIFQADSPEFNFIEVACHVYEDAYQEISDLLRLDIIPRYNKLIKQSIP